MLVYIKHFANISAQKNENILTFSLHSVLMIFYMIFSTMKKEDKVYWQLKASQIIASKGKENTGHKQAT